MEVSVSAANAPHVETTNTQMGEVIGNTKETVPRNGRGYMALPHLQPGVAPASSWEGDASRVSGNLNRGLTP
jgi:acyl CoA:acetate/3-ketoacid CoA transferase alpha subunit